MDMLEEKGVVGAPNGSKPREVLVDAMELETLKAFEANDAAEGASRMEEDDVAQTTFGEILREARERHGLDLATAARRLRIRPDILRAIEEGDFARMPPRGYTRNMVNAYARLVGLNPTENTRSRVDGAYAYQVGRARNEAQPSGFDMGASRRRSQRGREDARETRGERGRDGQGRRPGEPARQNAFGRVLYEDRTDAGGRTYAQDRMHPSRHAAVPERSTPTSTRARRLRGRCRSKLPFVIAAGVVLVVLVVVLVLVFGNRGEAEQDVPSVPITGLTDTSNPVDDATGGTTAPRRRPLPWPPTRWCSRSPCRREARPTSRCTRATAGRAWPKTWRGPRKRATTSRPPCGS